MESCWGTLLRMAIAGGTRGCALIAFFTLLGCAGTATAPPAAAGRRVAPDFALPAPSTLARQAAYVDADRTLPGALYYDLSDGGDCHVTVNGTSAVFSPSWDWYGVHTLANAARVFYVFDVTDYADIPTVEFEWAFPIADYSDLYVGLARWGADRWDWFAMSGPVLSLPKIAPYVSPDRGIYVAVVLLGLNSAQLNSIRVGPQLWKIYTVDNSVDAGGCSGLAMDTAGNPHIAYSDESNGDLRYAYIDGDGTTHIETVDSLGDVGRQCSLALDSADHPHIVYYNATESDLEYAYNDGSGWAYSTIDFADNDVLQYASIAIEAPAKPHVAYYKTGPQQIRHASYDGSKWVSELVVVAPVNDQLSLALAGGINPAIAYSTDVRAGYAWFEGGAWQDEQVATGALYVDSARALAFDASGRAWLVYLKLFTTRAYLACRDAGGWAIQAIPLPIDWNAGSGASLAVDSADVVHLACYGNPHLIYARLDGASWTVTEVDSSGWVGLPACLALDGDKPCISYHHEGNRELLFARRLY